MSRISRREFVKISATAVAGTILTACAPAAATTQAPAAEATKAPAAEATKAPAAEATKAPAAEATKAPEATAAPARTWPLGDVPRNQTLMYYWSAAPSAGNFSPFAAGYNHQNGTAILYEPCAYYGAHADKTYMWLAESYKYNADATECNITFRKGIMWSDGTPYTAESIAFMMKFLAANPGYNGSSTYGVELADAVAVDDLNLKVTLKQPDFRLFFKSLTYRFDRGEEPVFQPSHIFKDVPAADIAAFKIYDKAKGWPVGTSPYGVGDSTDQLTNYDLRPTWWAVETGFVEKYPDPVRIQQTLFTNDTVAAQKLINNEIDQPLDIRPLVVASLLAQAGDHITTWTGNKMPYGYTDWWPISVQFCTTKPDVSDPKVRWAISYAINREQLVLTAWGGAGKAANSPFPEFKKLDEYMAGIKDLTDQYNVLEYNPEKSAALMTEAGFVKNKDGFWAKDGVVPDFNLYAGVPLFGDLAPVIAEMLRSNGFLCEHKAPNDVWAAKTDGRASLFLYGHGGATIDPFDTMLLYRKADVRPLGTPAANGNVTRWFTDVTETTAEEVNKTAMDDPKMKDLFHTWMAEYYRELPDAPIVQWFHRVPVNTTYWSNWPNQENPYMNSALWHLTMAIVVYGLKATGA